MNIGKLVPPAEGHAAFELSSIKRIEDAAGCYVLTNASGAILYIGQAVSLPKRLVQHFDGEKRTMLTTEGRVSQVWWRCEDARRLNALERGWLEYVRLRDGVLPPMNRASAPV